MLTTCGCDITRVYAQKHSKHLNLLVCAPCEKCANAEFFWSGLNTVKYGPEKTPYLDTFHAVVSKASPHVFNTELNQVHMHLRREQVNYAKHVRT